MKNCTWFMKVNVNNLEIGIAVDHIPEEVVDFVYLFTKEEGIYDDYQRKVIRYYEGLNAEELEAVILSYVEHNICHAPQEGQTNFSSNTQEQQLFDPEE